MKDVSSRRLSISVLAVKVGSYSWGSGTFQSWDGWHPTSRGRIRSVISRGGFLRTVAVATFGVIGGCVKVFPPSGVTISFDGTLEATGGQFQVDGQLVGQGKIEDLQFEAVSVRFLDAAREQFDRPEIGNWRPSAGPLEFEVETNRTPEYVLFDSPDFWSSAAPEVTVYYWQRVDEGFREYPADSREELENPE